MEFYDYETEYSRDYQLTSSENANNFAIHLQDKIAITWQTLFDTWNTMIAIALTHK